MFEQVGSPTRYAALVKDINKRWADSYKSILGGIHPAFLLTEWATNKAIGQDAERLMQQMATEYQIASPPKDPNLEPGVVSRTGSVIALGLLIGGAVLIGRSTK
jgi:hypothetical protein